MYINIYDVIHKKVVKFKYMLPILHIMGSLYIYTDTQVKVFK